MVPIVHLEWLDDNLQDSFFSLPRIWVLGVELRS